MNISTERKWYEHDPLTPDRTMLNALVDLRTTVENWNRTMAGVKDRGTYRELDPGAIYTTKVHGWEFGYKLRDLGAVMERSIYVKCTEARLREVAPAERQAVMLAVFEAMLDQQQALPSVQQTAPDTLKLVQRFTPVFWVERNPNIVVPGGH